MNATVSTCNMAEALYLLGCGNRVVEVRLAWPEGLEECAIVFEGGTVEADHDRFIAHEIPVDLCTLPALFAAIAAALPKGGVA
jgi:hypothetical protein